jgi:hypothetical protein
MSGSEGPREPLSVAVRSGDRRRALTALRDRLADEAELAEGRDLAPLAKQLAEVIRELDALPLGKEASTSDALAARRAARLAGGSASAG